MKQKHYKQIYKQVKTVPNLACSEKDTHVQQHFQIGIDQ